MGLQGEAGGGCGSAPGLQAGRPPLPAARRCSSACGRKGPSARPPGGHSVGLIAAANAGLAGRPVSPVDSLRRAQPVSRPERAAGCGSRTGLACRAQGASQAASGGA